MANEYLKRTPTSTGNRKVWTWSGWVKISNLPVSGTNGDRTLFSATDAVTNGDDDAIRLIRTGITGENSLYWSSSEYNVSNEEIIYTRGVFRDVGGWMHIIFAKDTTEISSTDRIKIYVNGVRQQITESNAISQNDSRGINSLIPHAIGEHFGQVRYWNGEMTDVFFIDGQALTPDVFGFYKDGNGYISAGSTQATDFRPGQWVPKTPRVIKTEINRRGGFGVNGFYLPMNDSSNFGADFHTTPNSIITLKGEDLPQPRNGAPTTTDAYVSQLRTDPYAANLVLAVPGIVGGASTGYGDYSADIKGSGSNKTLTANGNAGVAVTASYYGSALSFDGNGDYFTHSSNSDFEFGTGDFTVEFWMKRTDTGTNVGLLDTRTTNTDGNGWFIRFNASTTIQLVDNGAQYASLTHTSDWNHIAFVRESNLITGYINGVAAGITTNVTKNFSSSNFLFGGFVDAQASPNAYGGYIQDLRIYKGVAKYKGGFDVPKPYTPVGIATWRAVPDTTANNFATWNPLQKEASGVLSNGNLTYIRSGGWGAVGGTIGLNSGKYYWEIMIDPSSSFNYIHAGISGSKEIFTSQFGTFAGSIIFTSEDNKVYKNTDSGIPTGLTMGVGDILQLAYDSTTRGFYVGVNGTFANSGNPIVTASDGYDYIPHITNATTPTNTNFGQNPTFSGQTTAGTFTDSNGKGLFKYEPPSGFLALCEDNLPTPAIKNPGEYFKTVLYNNATTVTGIGFTPDLIWHKSRTQTYPHYLYDSVRGVGAKGLNSNTTSAEGANDALGILSFDEDGFSFSSDAGLSQTNAVAWCWRAGAGTTSTNTNGSIQSVVSVNQDAGFSIVSYTGNQNTGETIGHGLGKKPAMIIAKCRGAVTSWPVYHKALGATNWILLNSTNATTVSSQEWNNTEPTTSVFTLGNGSANSNQSSPYVAYCWAEIEGFSKFGSYVGNGSADGPFVYCGFKPAFVLIKCSSDAESWYIYDSSRKSVNDGDQRALSPNIPDIEGLGWPIDFLSNGFKNRYVGATNNSGRTYIFAAFAESPFTTANAK